MDSIRQWAFSVCAAAIVCSLLQMLLPTFSVSKLARTAIAVFFLCALFQPIGFGSLSGDLDRGTEQSLEQARRYAETLDSRLTEDVSEEVAMQLREDLAAAGLEAEQYDLHIRLTEQSVEAVISLQPEACSNPGVVGEQLTKKYGVPVTITTKEE